MSLFDWLLVGHLVGDFLLQTDKMAAYKPRYWRWLVKHVGVYIAVMAVVIVGYALACAVPLWLAAVALLFILATHSILDRRSFTLWWMRLIGLSTEQMWLNIVVDQVFHLLVLAIVTQALTLMSSCQRVGI